MDKIQQNNAKNKKQGKRIRSRMKTLGIRQKDVAERIGASDATVSGWVNGKTSPTKKYLDKLAEQLNVTTDWIENGGYVSKKKIPGKVSDSAPYVQLSTIFKDRTKELKLRQLDIITQVDASRATVSNWFNGKALPNAANMESLSKALDVPLKDLTDAARNDEAEALRKQVSAELDDADIDEPNYDGGAFDFDDDNNDDDELENLLRLEAESAEMISADCDIHHDESSETQKSDKDITDTVDKSLNDERAPGLASKDNGGESYIQGGNMGGGANKTELASFLSPKSKDDNINDESVAVDMSDDNSQPSSSQYHEPKPKPEPEHVEKSTADESANADNADNAKEQGCITEETTITFTINIVTKKYQS